MLFFDKNKKVIKSKAKRRGPFVTKLGDVKHNKLEDPSYRSEWTENSFLSGFEEKETVGKTFNYSRLKLIAGGLLFLLLIMIARVGWLQIAKGEYYSGMAEGNRIRVKEIASRRGVIYDRELTPLVRNVANFVLYLIPADLPGDKEERNRVIDEVVALASSEEGRSAGELSASEIKKKIAQQEKQWLLSYEPLLVADNIPYEKAMLLYLKSRDWAGVVLTNKSRRQYLLDTEVEAVASEEEEEHKYQKVTVNSASHILGYTGKINPQELENSPDVYSSLDYTGKSGIEKFWEQELRGEKGVKRVEVDALGKEKRVISRTEPRDGHNLVLSLDMELQGKIEQIVESHLDNIGAPGASVVAMDPETGGILSLVSVPGYDNNKFAQGISSEDYKELSTSPGKPLFNRAVSGEYPPGSTFKLIVGAAALEEGVITERSSFKSTGGIRVSKWFFPDWRAGGHGITDIRKAISQSVNTFFYYIGGGYNDFEGLGMEKIIEYAKKFGLGEETGIDLPSEADGFLPSEQWKQERFGEQWYIGDTYHLAIGQGFLSLTPLQLAAYTSVFANKGVLYRPHLVKRIQSTSGEVVREIRPDVVKRDIVDPYNIGVVREGMKQAVTSGSCRRLLSLNETAAGKTGTAQWSTKEKPHAWFTGFAPYDDPEITLTVLIEKGGGGDEVAVPIAEEIFKYYFDKDKERK
jgi:penicillin-binding protein 2